MFVGDQSLSPSPGEVCLVAERSLLGALMASPGSAGAVWGVCMPGMFWTPQNRFLGDVLHRMWVEGAVIDPTTVVARLIEDETLARVGGGPYIHALYSEAWAVDHAPQWARLVRDAWQRRKITEDTQRLLQRAQSPAVSLTELTVDIAEIADTHLEIREDQTQVEKRTILDLLAERHPRINLIPGLLCRGDRYVYTGGEGIGKSELAAQLACCAVAGVHPFGGEDFEPLTVTMIDAENATHQDQGRFPRVMSAVERLSVEDVEWRRLYRWNRPEGLSLLKPENLQWVHSVMKTTQPDILFIGSMYKLYRGSDINDEAAAGIVTDILDDIRTRYGCAVVVEAHMGKAEDFTGRRKTSPRGSSALMGWPEFGHGLVKSPDDRGEHYAELVDLMRFRGDRVQADWPYELRRGGPGELPWMPR